MKKVIIAFATWLLKKAGAGPFRHKLTPGVWVAEEITTGSPEPAKEEIVKTKVVAIEKPVELETVDCETCGCMIKKIYAVISKPIIRHVPEWDRLTYRRTPNGEILSEMKPEYEIYYVHYCKACAPKSKKKSKA